MGLIKTRVVSPGDWNNGHGLPPYHIDPFFLDALELGLRVADGFETEDAGAIRWRCHLATMPTVERMDQ